jgi:pilus assembly protein CpaB
MSRRLFARLQFGLWEMRFGGLIAAIVFAAIAAVIVLRMSANDTPAPSAQPAQQQLKTVNVFVAAAPIAVGTTISAEMVAVQPWPEHLMLDGFIKSDAGTANVVGMVARAPFQQQEPILASKLANPNDPNFLAGDLPKGMRVITIMTNETEGLAGFVFPGDHVDVILTHDVDKWVRNPGADGASAAPTQAHTSVTETLLTNVKVLAVDQRATGANATDKDGKLIIPRSVSLMVSPTDAQRIRLGEKIGTLTLALRSLQDRESADPLTLTGLKDISQYPDNGGDVGGSGGNGVTIIRGTSEGQAEHDSAGGNAAPAQATPQTALQPQIQR